MREVNKFEFESPSGGGFVLGLLCAAAAGAAVGVAVGLLLAPKTGSELRQQISESTGRIRRGAADGYSATVEAVSGAVGDVIARGKKARRRGQQAYDDVRQGAQEVKQAVSEAVPERL
jgi:gas vesicle protein